VEIEGDVFYVYVVKRPAVDDFLLKMSRLYEVVIYTASLSLYADPLLEELDPNHIASYRLFREHCTFYNNSFVKDLSALGRNLKDVIIVDNSPASYAFQPENAIPISTWIDDMTDNKLAQLAPILELLAYVDDVRDYIKKVVQDDSSSVSQDKEPSVQEEKAPVINSWVDETPPPKAIPQTKAVHQSPASAVRPATGYVQHSGAKTQRKASGSHSKDNAKVQKQEHRTSFSNTFSHDRLNNNKSAAKNNFGDKNKRPSTANNEKKKPETPTPSSGKLDVFKSNRKLGKDFGKPKPQLHYQPRQHSQNPKPKAESTINSTPKTMKPSLPFNNNKSSQKNSNPALKKASFLYGNLIKAKYEKSQALVKGKPTIMANGTFNANKLAVKTNNCSVENSESGLPIEKLRNELNFNSPKNQLLPPHLMKQKISLLSGYHHNHMFIQPSAKNKPIPEKTLKQTNSEPELSEPTNAENVMKSSSKAGMLKQNSKFNMILADNSKSQQTRCATGFGKKDKK
jgi:RNA polymerase II subunit A small phosphatase-like protein